MKTLKNAFTSVDSGNDISYGGSQLLSQNKTIKSVGCGVISAADILLYISAIGNHTIDYVPGGIQSINRIPLVKYNRFISKFRRKFLLVPGFGINALFLVASLNLFFNRTKSDVRACWNIRVGNIRKIITRSIDNDIPLTLAIGPSLNNAKLRLYAINEYGNLKPVCRTKSHYVTVTGYDKEWIQISSWGKKYYIKFDEYMKYIKKSSLPLISNVLYLKLTGGVHFGKSISRVR